MKRLTNSLFLLCFAMPSFAQDSIALPPKMEPYSPFPAKKELVREYFFENVNFAENHKELVVLAKDPQTQLAEDLGFRIYRDTAFLNKIESEFYRDVDPTSRVVHFCGHDLYFYIKSGNNLKFHRMINSHCGISELGCEDLDILFTNGTPLSADTLSVLDFESLAPKEIIPEDVVYAEFVSSDGYWEGNDSYFSNNCARPAWTYDGKFQAILKVDTVKPVDHFIKEFFSHVDSLEFKNIIYRLDEEDEKKLDIFTNVALLNTELRLIIYLDEDCYAYFKEYTIEPIQRKREKIELSGRYLVLLR